MDSELGVNDPTLPDLFRTYREGDTAETVFRATVQSATSMLWILGAADRTLAALYDVLNSASGKQGLRAALAACLAEGHDAVA
jgi:hypothetical protein